MAHSQLSLFYLAELYGRAETCLHHKITWKYHFVLEDMTEEAGFKYASLILETAGDQRGFTTCLSSSAKTLKYRLNLIRFHCQAMMHPISYLQILKIGMGKPIQ